MRVYNGTNWVVAGSSVNGTSTRQAFIASAGQTTFVLTYGYDANFADVYMNGRKLINGIDVDITSGLDFTLTVAALAGDVLDFVGYGTFEIADVYTKGEVYNRTETDTFLDTKALKLQDVNTDTQYQDNTTATQFKLYIDNGDIILEEL